MTMEEFYNSNTTSMTTKNYVVPNSNDILCGRGAALFNHPGNRKFRIKIAQTLDEYNSCGSRQGRTEIIREIIRYVMVEQGGRFLKSDIPTKQQQNQQQNYFGPKWYDGGMKVAKIKVSTAFRDARIPNKVKCMAALKRSISDSGACSTTSVDHVKPLMRRSVSDNCSTSVNRFNRNDSYCSQSASNELWSSSSMSLKKEENTPQHESFSSFDSLSTYLMTTDLIPYPSSSYDDNDDTAAMVTRCLSLPRRNSCCSQKEVESLLFDNTTTKDFDAIIDVDSIDNESKTLNGDDDSMLLTYKMNQQRQPQILPRLGSIVKLNAQCA